MDRQIRRERGVLRCSPETVGSCDVWVKSIVNIALTFLDSSTRQRNRFVSTNSTKSVFWWSKIMCNVIIHQLLSVPLIDLLQYQFTVSSRRVNLGRGWRTWIGGMWRTKRSNYQRFMDPLCQLIPRMRCFEGVILCTFFIRRWLRTLPRSVYYTNMFVSCKRLMDR